MIITKTFREEILTKVLHTSFKKYAEPLVESLIVGDVVSIRHNVMEGWSVDHDWVAKTRFRNTLNVSVYAGVAYTYDSLSLCRQCKMYLVTRELFDVIAAYYWVNPIYRTQFLGITGTEADYESMLFTADKFSQRYLREKMNISQLGIIALDVIKYHTAKMTNRSIKGVNVYTEYDRAISKYISYMKENHNEAFKTARKYPAQQCMVNDNGFIVLEQTMNDEKTRRSIK